MQANFEDCRRHRISRYEPISASPLFQMSVLDACESPTRPVISWANQKSETINDAKSEIDSQIRLSAMVAVINHKKNKRLDGTHYEVFGIYTPRRQFQYSRHVAHHLNRN